MRQNRCRNGNNMLEARYYKDYRHNYMILQCRQKEAARSYQYKILTSDKIREILRCSVRHINGMIYYYYDISSRTTLENLYQGKKMSGDQVKDVLWQLHGICERLSGYFMDEAGLVLLPEHIYYDMTERKYIGLYYPDYRTVGEEAYRPLMDFLLEHIDTEDQRLTENMYRIYEMSEQSHFTIEDALQILEEDIQPVNVQAAEPDVQTVYEPMSESIETVTEIYEMTESESMQEKGSSRTPPGHSLFYAVTAGLSLLGAAGAFAVYYMYELTEIEEIALLGVMAAVGICFLMCMTGILRNGRRKSVQMKRSGRDSEKETYNGFDKGTNIKYPEEGGPVSLEHVISRDMDLELAGHCASAPFPASPMFCRDTSSLVRMSGVAGAAENDYGNTVFFDESRVEEYKLYAMDRRNKKHIELRQFPCTVGKMAGCVDHVLADDSVSRIHARFDKQGERVLLTDMNSTNGTYKNGLRMQPQETVEIESGDEIRFGNLNYCYR